MTSVEVPYSIAAALPTLAVLDITNEVAREVRDLGATEGIAFVTPTAQSSLVRVNERESGFFSDLEELLGADRRAGREGPRAAAAPLLGPRTEQVPFHGGALCLGQWQRVMLFGLGDPSRLDWQLTLSADRRAGRPRRQVDPGFYDRGVNRARRHPRLLSGLAFGLLALAAELLGRSLTHRMDIGRHVEAPGYVRSVYYPFLLAAVKVGIALLLARLAWRFARARVGRARRPPDARRRRRDPGADAAAGPDRPLAAALAALVRRHLARCTSCRPTPRASRRAAGR